VPALELELADDRQIRHFLDVGADLRARQRPAGLGVLAQLLAVLPVDQAGLVALDLAPRADEAARAREALVVEEGEVALADLVGRQRIGLFFSGPVVARIARPRPRNASPSPWSWSAAYWTRGALGGAGRPSGSAPPSAGGSASGPVRCSSLAMIAPR
jgi:hypothetical protein